MRPQHKLPDHGPVLDREAIFASMPPEPECFSRLDADQLEVARATRAEYGLLAVRNRYRINRILWLVAVALIVLVVIGLASGVLSLVVQTEQATTVSRVQDNQHHITALALANRKLIHENASLTRQIQKQRRSGILQNCRDQNRRHDKTVRQLDRGIKSNSRHASSARAARLRASRKFTILLIDALQPRQNCQRLAQAAVPRKPSRIP